MFLNERSEITRPEMYRVNSGTYSPTTTNIARQSLFASRSSVFFFFVLRCMGIEVYGNADADVEADADVDAVADADEC
jgi:hypothetical protein